MLIVQKYGGSSLKTVDHIDNVAKKVKSFIDEGHQVVMVVSAMGDFTDELVEKAEQLSKTPSAREMDALLATGELQSAALMAMRLEQLGVPAQSFSGQQAGIVTNYDHGKARIQQIDPVGLRRALAAGLVPVVAGFQGITPTGHIATLGRGGSDLTAIALAGALKADRCEIYSDVAGVYTADPRIIPSAIPLNELSYDEMMELASQGAQVLQTQAVEYAKGEQVTIYARSTFSDAPGTMISERHSVVKPPVTAVAINRRIAKIGLMGVPDAPGIAALVFSRLAEEGINIDLVFQALSHENLNDIAFTVQESDVPMAQRVVEGCLAEIGGRDVVVDTNVAKISAIGSGMLGRPGVAAQFFRAIAARNINIHMIGTSEVKVSVIVSRDDADTALRQVHDAFELGDTQDVVED